MKCIFAPLARTVFTSAGPFTSAVVPHVFRQWGAYKPNLLTLSGRLENQHVRTQIPVPLQAALRLRQNTNLLNTCCYPSVPIMQNLWPAAEHATEVTIESRNFKRFTNDTTSLQGISRFGTNAFDAPCKWYCRSRVWLPLLLPIYYCLIAILPHCILFSDKFVWPRCFWKGFDFFASIGMVPSTAILGSVGVDSLELSGLRTHNRSMHFVNWML